MPWRGATPTRRPTARWSDGFSPPVPKRAEGFQPGATGFRASMMSITKAIILSAGQGSRLLPLTRDLPKCLIEFNGRSLLGWQVAALVANGIQDIVRSEEHTSELQSLMRISYAVFCLKKNKTTKHQSTIPSKSS